MYEAIFKRLGDIFFSLLLLVLLSPIIVIFILILLFVNKGKPFFFQRRPGKDEKVFTIIKFKTMTDEKDADGILLPNALRVTPIGNFIRKTSIDELLQLVNVLKGDMSLIGPRPLLIKYLPYYTQEEKLRHSVRPGITGLAQVSGRNLLEWDSRLALDVKYVKELSFYNDIMILIRTVLKVFDSKDVVLDQSETMPDLDVFRKNKYDFNY
ncbi:Sugar transferase involved in LPS biosynthesis (colanic, teichoic acid) [Muriicola jejuensis]|uniref:Sugar transferase n=1 Tax=Muriicola jejuensis TaxID=504488 RepID=A0A6P0UIC3_9FLAO|nr:sugar transferase [Muriicola jejuensis]NER11539.1 sugar transferase [Muriicola jejuensis]SMP19845.1 Sugar transferase involved in LPS biosynthesis (colanic, teichoic acid) [Muriicola jejuensis]